jgi:pyruvate,water dikinase
VLAKMPSLFATIPKRISAAAAQTDMWWRSEVSLAPVRDLPGAIRQMFAAQARMELSLKLTAEAAFAGAQPVFDKLLDVATTVGRPDLAGKVLSGHGSHVETRLVDDLWELSRQRLSLDAYLDRHGYHGPLEGEVSARVWREDPAPVLELARRYAEQEEEHSPSLRASERAVEGERAARELYAALPRSKRPAARLVLTLARTYLPLRGIGKIPFLQSLDVIRAGARRAGDLLATDGHLDDPDDVFFLLLEELREGPAADWRERIAARKTERHEYEHLSLPMQWRGKAPVTPTEIPASGSPIADTPVVVTGVAASPGTYEGPVRVVTDPALTDIEPGEILVAHITDPSWASVLFLAGALVVDIGGALSHTAIVSREMGVPCVTGTDVATGVLRTGDICRVDGTTGRVELIARPEARVN